MRTEFRLIVPQDVLYLRGNRLFGGAGDRSEAMMPPWPSIVAGALRARMLVDHDVRLSPRKPHAVPEGPLGPVLGSVQHPGRFRVRLFSLAHEKHGLCFPTPSDLVIGANGQATALQPARLPPMVGSSAGRSEIPILRQAEQSKPSDGWWLTANGLTRYLSGQPLLSGDDLIHRTDLWRMDPRLGIALDAQRRSAADGKLYTSETIALSASTAFAVAVAGAEGLLPDAGLLRFGGDGRGAEIRPFAATLPEPDWDAMARNRCCRLVLSAPGLFDGGWRLPGLDVDGRRWQSPDGTLRGDLVCASVSRAQVVSGWDIARWVPKPAQRAVPMGSVYWLRNLEGDDIGASLRHLADRGLWTWGDTDNVPGQRCAEGFNTVFVANWQHD